MLNCWDFLKRGFYAGIKIVVDTDTEVIVDVTFIPAVTKLEGGKDNYYTINVDLLDYSGNSIGRPIHKVGRTTGWTSGRVEDYTVVDDDGTVTDLNDSTCGSGRADPPCRVLSRHLARHSHCRPPSVPPKAPVTPSPPSAVLTPSIPVHRWIRG